MRIKLWGHNGMLSRELRIKDLIQAIETKKQELSEAEYIVTFYPSMINELEKELFELLKE